MNENKLQIFKSEEFGSVRTLDDDGTTLFCGSDVAKALGYSRPNDAVAQHARYTVKRRIPHPQAENKEIEMLFIPESDVYRLITHSKLPAAEKFEHWLFEEVVPSIRKHGAYVAPDTLERMISSPEFGIRLLNEIKEERAKRAELERQVEKDKPKVIFAGAVETAKTSILVGDLAKILKQNGIEIGQKRLFAYLRENGYLMKDGSSQNMPTQRSMERGLFEIKESVVCHADGHTTVNKTPKVTGKGQVYFTNLFLGQQMEMSQ